MLESGQRACRSLVRNRAYTLVTVLLLGLGLGMTTALLSIARALTELPSIDAPERLVVVWQQDTRSDRIAVEVSYPELLEWRRHPGSGFESLAGFGSVHWAHMLTGAGEPQALASAAVSANFFDTLRARPLIGRAFRPADDDPGAEQVALLSHGLWSRSFGADADVVGRTIHLEGDTDGVEGFRVIGVMPPGFDFPRGTDVWTPVGRRLAWATRSMSPQERRDLRVLHLIGRLAPGLDDPTASRLLSERIARLATSDGASFVPTGAVLTPLVDYHLGQRTRPILWLLSGAVLLVLLAACANVAGLSGVVRLLGARDIALRMAIGASRRDMAREAAARATLLGLASAGLGAVFASALLRAVRAVGPSGVPGLAGVGLDGPVLATTLLTSLAVALLATASQELARSDVDVFDALRSGGGGAVGGWKRLRPYVAAQLAVAVATAVAAGVLVRSYVGVMSVDLGYDTRGVLTFKLRPQSSRYPTLASGRSLVSEVLRRLRDSPRVIAAGATMARPLEHGDIGSDTGFFLEGQEPGASARNPQLNWQVVTPGYFRAMGMPVLAGRAFDEGDTASSPPVAMLGQSLANRYWPARSAVGEKIFTAGARWDPETGAPIFQTIVGVVPDGRYRGLESPHLDVYVPAEQAAVLAGTIVARLSGEPSHRIPEVLAVVGRVDALLPVDGVTTMKEVVRAATGPWRLGAAVLVLFAVVTGVLSLVGLRAMLAYSISSRKREIAVRRAIGADSRRITRLIARETAGVVLAGLAIGAAISTSATGLLEHLVFSVAALDAWSYLAAMGLVGLFAVLITWSAAARWGGTELAPALRAE